MNGWPTEKMILAASDILYKAGLGETPHDKKHIALLVVEAALAAAPALECGECGNAECSWRGQIAKCSYLGVVGPCCPECREIVEPCV